jgi:DNA-binding winged helix-turn-helix (wHTH) protein/TolB-like protein/Flp pilus assembly protein TadD
MSFKGPEKNLKTVELVSSGQNQEAYEFGAYRIDQTERQLLRAAKPVPITAKAFDTLLLLVQRAGHLVEKSEIIETIWPDSFVEEGNLAVTIHMLRKALGDDGGDHKYIETVAKRGYRFVGEVRRTSLPILELPVTPVESHSALKVSALPARLAWSSLNFVLRISVLTVIAVVAVFAFVRGWRPSEARTKVRSLAVLPFRNLNANPKQDYVGLGLADAIITELGSTGQVIVRPTSAVMKYGDSRLDPLSIGREEKVDAVLAGNIEVLSDRVRVTAQLVRVADGYLLWADTFAETPQRMFALEQEVEEKVAAPLAVSLAEDTKKNRAKLENQNLKAYQLYLMGRYFWNKRTVEGLRRSIEYFQQATIEDPRYAAAFAGLADSYALLGTYGIEASQQANPSAKSAARRALQIDDSLSEAHTSLGMISFYYEWNWPQAEHEFRRSIQLNPNYPLAHEWYAEDLAATGRTEEALTQVQRALELDPLSLIINTEVGRMFYLTRNYDQAVVAYRKVLDMDPQFARAHSRLGMAYAADRRFDDAIREFQLAKDLAGPDPYLDGLLGYAYALSGSTSKAHKLLEDLTEQHARGKFVPSFSMALISIGLGDRNQALEWLSKSYSDRSCYMVFAKTDPLLDPLRSDPRFQALLNRMGLS